MTDNGKTFYIEQGNNALLCPVFNLGMIVSSVKYVTVGVLLAAVKVIVGHGDPPVKVFALLLDMDDLRASSTIYCRCCR